MKKERSKITLPVVDKDQMMADDMKAIAEAYRMDVEQLNRLPR